jgi:predicted small secreted protein
MNRYHCLQFLSRVACALFAVALAGCASTPGVAPDLQSLGNAIAIDDVRTVRQAVESKSISVNDVVAGIGYAATPMITVAARNGATGVLRYLISAKADLNARTPDRDTAVMLAALFKDEDRERNSVSTHRYDLSVRLLADAGANLENVEPNAYTALAYAAYAGRESTVQYLLQKGARVNGGAQGRVSHANTPLMMAAMQGYRGIVMQLLRAGADARVRVQNGMTALEFAQKNNHTHVTGPLRCAENLKPGENFRARCE